MQARGTNSQHQPVLLAEVLELLRPASREVVLDCTVGFGGHAAEIMQRIGKDGFLLGIDLDRQCIDASRQKLAGIGSNFDLWRGNFAQSEKIVSLLAGRRADVILADLGVNSQQLSDPQRGFSFMHDGPLRMIMSDNAPQDAGYLVNSLPEKELADLIYRYGQERHARRVARHICRARQEGRICTTGQLATIITRAVGPAGRRWRIHPATRTFQALRIAVNSELDNLRCLLAGVGDILAVGGRLGVISFHSLEDRLVKHNLREQARQGLVKILTPSPVRPSQAERRANPRSRSAKLRVAQRLA